MINILLACTLLMFSDIARKKHVAADKASRHIPRHTVFVRFQLQRLQTLRHSRNR